MNQLQRVKDLLSRVTYKPGWTITADCQGFSWEKGEMGAVETHRDNGQV
jgi:hypothetical protein